MQVENGPATPIAISNMKSLDRVSNVMKLAWHHDNNSKIKNYAVSINLMKRRTGKELVQRLRSLGVRDKQWTLAMNEFTVSCSSCKHLQCFDAETFICMQEKKPFRVFKCPVCNQHINFDDFRIDGYFVELLGKLAPGANLNIEIEPDGTWAPAKTEKERTRALLRHHLEATTSMIQSI
ncbi:E3 SUMO-protein ligase PIAS1 [Orchesella cincta]|uniref:E3 SUMO-protein ligase PIAS1 n=1 Tax=Orchesella cincta TaxID=48709 RepID=A0A1D2MED2_ORCCI|nr:E3 SUMO-protein ligase PIAS1 [Orchesella cincta]